MTSKISLNKLIREDLRHRSWQIVLSCLVQIIFGPLALMLALTTSRIASYNSNLEDLKYRAVRSFFGDY